MNITSAKYVKTDNENSSITIVVDGKVISVPLNVESNRHWVALQKWVDDGNTIEEAD